MARDEGRDVGLLHALSRAARATVPPVPRGRGGLLAFGWVLVVLLVTQVVTGILLSFYYQASPRMAPESVRFVMRDVDWGWLIRGIHHWASVLMVAVCCLQLLRVFAAGSYRGARAGVWCVGLVLMLCVWMFDLTGRLLPWDRSAHAVASRVLAEVERIPALGAPLVALLRGGPEVGAATLGRAHATHVALLPFVSGALLLLALWYLATRPRATRVDRAPRAGEGRT